MSALTLESLNNYIETTASNREILISCGDGSIKIDTDALSDKDKINTFINKVVSGTYLDIVKPNYFYKDVAFISHFLKIFTDFPVPSKQVDDGIEIDSQKTYEMAVALNIYNNIMLIPEIQNLYDYINKQIEFRNAELLTYISTSSASSELIETISNIANRSLDAVDKICDVLDNVKSLSENDNLLKLIPESRMHTIFDQLQKIINNTITSLKN